MAPIFVSPRDFIGQEILVATEYLTVPQMCRVYERVSGKSVTVTSVDVSTVPVVELQATIQLLNKLGYFLGKLIEPSLEKYPQNTFGNFEAWLRRSKFQPHPAA